MPKFQSLHLVAVGSHLRAIEGKLAPGKSLKWSRTDSFCSIHEAELNVIPLGVRHGFDIHIDFRKIQERLATGWIGEEMATLVHRPQSSPFFNDVVASMEEMGSMRWRSLDQQMIHMRKGLTTTG